MNIRAFILLLALGCSDTRQAFPDASAGSGDASSIDIQSPADASTDPDDAVEPPPDTGEPDGDEQDVDEPDGAGPDTAEPPAPLEPRTCTRTFTYPVVGQLVEGVSLAGEFNGWDPVATPMADPDGDGLWTVDLDTTGLAGSYGYKFVIDPTPAENDLQWVLDPSEPMRKTVDGIENSKVLIEDCRVPLLEVESMSATAEAIHVVVAVRDGAGSPGITQTRVRHAGADLDGVWDADSQRFTVSIPNPAQGKHSLVFEAEGPHGEATPLYLPLWIEDEAFAWQDAVLYFVMTDRFADGDPTVGLPDGCLPPENMANWQGGDWIGVRQKIEEGYFDDLGVNALWLTAVVDNPQGCFSGQLGKQYTSYHGYFPSAQRSPEGQLGTLEDLRALVDAAHARGMRVLVDLVANHLHDSNPVYQAHSDWFHGYFQCGFEEAPLSCWFESYLPDLDYQEDAAVEEMTEMALWWVREADLDGFRVDAVKHMHDNFVRTLRAKLETQVETVPGVTFYTVGETFTGDWGGGNGPNETIIKKYVGPSMLHGQFDFPLYWRILRFFARSEDAGFAVADLLEAAQGYYGPQAIMSNFLGNHDVPRFISHAAGQIGDTWGNGSKEQGWDNPPGQPTAAEPYRRAQLGFSFLMTIQGVPLIYYGDEIGLAGAGDPDNRRPMAFAGWSTEQQALFEHVGRVAKIRHALPALRRGNYATVEVDSDMLVYRREWQGDTVVVALNRSGAPRSATVSLTDGIWVDHMGGPAVTASGGSGLLSIPAWGTVILSKE